MKILIFLAVFTFSLHASQIKLNAPCNNDTLYQGDYFYLLPPSLGEFAVHFFSDNEIPFQGSEMGFNSILETPIGLDALVVIDDQTMLAFGWCFKHNGKIKELMANEIEVLRGDKVEWFYGHARMENNTWTQQCVEGPYNSPLNPACSTQGDHGSNQLSDRVNGSL